MLRPWLKQNGRQVDFAMSARLRKSPKPTHRSALSPNEIDSYLKAQDGKWEAFKANNPLSPEMVQRFERAKRERSIKP